MSNTWRWTILTAASGLYLAGLTWLGGVAIDEARLEHEPMRVANQYRQDAALRRLHADLTRRGAGEAPWARALGEVDGALARKNVSAAELAWHHAYGAALRSRRWEGLVEVGDAYLKIGRAAGRPRAWEAKARRIYLAALFRARQQGSLDGVLRTTEAFAALGDHEVVRQGLRIAERMAAESPDAGAVDRTRALRERLTTPFFIAAGP